MPAVPRANTNIRTIMGAESLCSQRGAVVTTAQKCSLTASELRPLLTLVGQANVVLGFMPDRLHNERMAEYRVFAGRDGALNRLRLRNVSRRPRRRAVGGSHRTDPVKASTDTHASEESGEKT